MITGNLIDIPNREIYFAEVEITDGRIGSVRRTQGQSSSYILPGFVDAHVHIESSMLVPSQFARLAVLHGTVATVSDPHEIANVMGIEGVKYMIDDGNRVPFKFFFGAPSCVPATDFETSGARVDVAGVRQILEMPEVKYLAEMMNYPGVIARDELVLAKLEAAKQLGLPIDGHAPGLRGEAVETYISAGISTDHEASTYEEGLEKLQLGMKLLIREGSAAKNFDALIDLLSDYPEQIMFCSDDKHPDDLLRGHINQLVARALDRGFDFFDVLQAACINPVHHYNLGVGLLREGDPADLVITDDIKTFGNVKTYIDGQLVGEAERTYIDPSPARVINRFVREDVTSSQFHVPAEGDTIRVIEAIDGELMTDSFESNARIENGLVIADVERDILKFTVVNRYCEAPPALAFIRGFAFEKGAIASCVAHDSHNIVAVGADDQSIVDVVNEVIRNRGGIALSTGDDVHSLPLPVGGIMTNRDAYDVAIEYQELDIRVKSELGTGLTAPFMTLSFMALLVIPSLKLGDKGLFDGESFQFTDLFVD